MRILSIETSCDETAVSIIEVSGDFKEARFRVLGDQLLSQAKLHEQYGGVYPSLAKREHAKNLIPLFEEVLKKAGMYSCTGPAPQNCPTLSVSQNGGHLVLDRLLEREPELLHQFLRLFAVLERPPIDAIAVTHGPGLEPALWVGVNFAKALAHEWNVPVIPVNHMEGHILTALLEKKGSEEFSISNIQFPILALLISGGHTELVLMKNWMEYEIVGETRDDAVGEAFDKVARMLGLPYPGGPEISRLAEAARRKKHTNILENVGVFDVALPRPMLDSNDFDFSFSGLKTAVLYYLKEHSDSGDSFRENQRQFRVSPRVQSMIALEFENAVTDILIKKTLGAIKQFGAYTLVVSGGVSANAHIRKTFTETLKRECPDVTLFIPESRLATDNAIMIAIAGYYRWLARETHPLPTPDTIRANGTLRLS